ncbi:MAG: NADH-quinone oxidoreductase subunit C [Bacteroidia bacterium]|nr:NADH-quinone oxidoreductase subunit C [Bacteroidia bacterium]
MAENNFLDTIKSSSFQDYIIEVRGYANEITVEVDAKKILEVLKVLRDQFGFNFLSDITGSDYYTDEKRFEVSYNLVNIEGRRRMRVSCRIEEDDPSLDSVTSLWESADWYEREVWDMMGIKFNNHPDLRRMFMPEDYEWHPLRKEFPLLGIPGSIPLPEKDPPKEYK